jgi:hypothetical protein
MPINDANINSGAKEMVKMLDHSHTRQDAEVVADRLRADFMDCMGQGDEGSERWRHIVKAMRTGEEKGKGYDLQITGDSSLPVVTLVDSQHGFTIGGVNIGKDALKVSDDHSKGKGLLADPESGITNTRVPPIEMR